MSNTGRWTGRWYEWACETCFRVMTSLNAPAPEERCCVGCRAQTGVMESLELVQKLHDAANTLAAENLALKREVADKADRIAELETHIRELQGVANRAHTGSAA